jgi:hypothetical protein
MAPAAGWATIKAPAGSGRSSAGVPCDAAAERLRAAAGASGGESGSPDAAHSARTSEAGLACRPYHDQSARRTMVSAGAATTSASGARCRALGADVVPAAVTSAATGAVVKRSFVTAVVSAAARYDVTDVTGGPASRSASRPVDWLCPTNARPGPARRPHRTDHHCAGRRPRLRPTATDGSMRRHLLGVQPAPRRRSAGLEDRVQVPFEELAVRPVRPMLGDCDDLPDSSVELLAIGPPDLLAASEWGERSSRPASGGSAAFLGR